MGVVDELTEFLPSPQVRKDGEDFELYEPAQTIGKVHDFHGNWLVLIKAMAYIARLGEDGLCDTSANAVLNANYLAEQIDLDIPYEPFHHEFVASAGDLDAARMAKRMLDFGVHPPTTKWPEIVSEALMTEPTEGESKRTLDELAEAFNAAYEASEEELETAPHRSTARHIDQADAARNTRLSWHALEE